jgi:hypothetical protein
VTDVVVADVVDWLAPLTATPLPLLSLLALAEAVVPALALDGGAPLAGLLESSLACGAGALLLALFALLLALF